MVFNALSVTGDDFKRRVKFGQGQTNRKKVAEGEFTFVSIDEAGKPQPVDR